MLLSYHFYVYEVFYLTLEYYSNNFFDKNRINDLSYVKEILIKILKQYKTKFINLKRFVTTSINF